MFAFPLMYPGATLAAAGWPLVGIIAVTLVFASGGFAHEDKVILWALTITYYALFAWLAVCCHRAVLGTLESSDEAGSGPLGRALRYLAALTAGSIAKSLSVLILVGTASLLLLNGIRYVPTEGLPPPTSAPLPDPHVQDMINYLSYVMQAPALYLLARLSPLLPALALGREWSLRTAWDLSRGNGWRLVLVVFLLPWLFDASVGLVYAAARNPVLVACLGIVTALLAALSVIALSLAYRELAAPAPPPTAPPA